MAIAQTVLLTMDTDMGVGITAMVIDMGVSVVETAAHRGNAISTDQTQNKMSPAVRPNPPSDSLQSKRNQTKEGFS